MTIFDMQSINKLELIYDLFLGSSVFFKTIIGLSHFKHFIQCSIVHLETSVIFLVLFFGGFMFENGGHHAAPTVKSS